MSSARKTKKLFARSSVTVDPRLDERILNEAQAARDESRKRWSPLTAAQVTARSRLPWRRVGSWAAAVLVLAGWAAFFVAYKQITDLKDRLASARAAIVSAPPEDSVSINLYLTEHREVVARQASLNTTPTPPLQMRFHQEDLLYYESYDEPDSVQPGVILRGRPSQRETGSSASPAISNGHTLTLSEARQVADFDLVSPAWLRPCYRLDEIRRIENRDALQLLYTDGIGSISLFEQPLDGRRGLGPQDFREYVLYRNEGQAGGAILTWRDEARLYVLVGNAEISQLMDMAQSINAAK
jgi:hypothetical protein